MTRPPIRHVVNFGLLFCFLTLAVTGAMAYLFPFAVSTTRTHIVFGLASFILVGLHLAERLPYFRAQLIRSPRRDARVPPRVLAGILVGWGILLALSLTNSPPARLVMDQSYEARHRAAIVRSSPLAGALAFNDHRLVARQPGANADAALSLFIGFSDPMAPPPSMAVWTESRTGTMIETLYIDEDLAFSDHPDWGGMPTPRHHILPLWRHRYTMMSGVGPTGEVDAFTGATPTHSFTLDDYLVLDGKTEFVLCVEVNSPGDPNPAFPDPHRGQPSLLYAAFISLDRDQPYTLLQLTGHGGGAEQNGAIHYDLEKFTSAPHLIDLLLAKVTPPSATPSLPSSQRTTSGESANGS